MEENVSMRKMKRDNDTDARGSGEVSKSILGRDVESGSGQGGKNVASVIMVLLCVI